MNISDLKKIRIKPYEYYIVSYFKKYGLDSMSISDLKKIRIRPYEYYVVSYLKKYIRQHEY